MPLPFRRVVPLALALALFAAIPAGQLALAGSRPVRSSGTWIVGLRPPDGPGLPTRRGGLRANAEAIGRQRAESTSRTIDALQASVGFTASHRYTYAVAGFAARLNDVQLAALRSDRRVQSIRRARPVTPAGQLVPSSVVRVGATPGTAPAASADVTVAVVDTGVGRRVSGAWLHQGELNVVAGVNAWRSDLPCAGRVTDPHGYDDDHGHGTHVAGTIGAQHNDVGVVGVAPWVKLISVRVFEHGFGDDATVICGLDWIAWWNTTHAEQEAQDIDVVNMSLRGPAPDNQQAGCDTEGNTDLEELAVCAVVDTGAVVVVAAGNETREVANYIPSRYANVITVSAMSDFDGEPGGQATESCSYRETDDAFASYSNFGPEVDITAPGTCVQSTDWRSADGYLTMTGTSMATPHVAGAIARYLSSLSSPVGVGAIRKRLIDSANLDWDAATDNQDDEPDRLLDVDALLSQSPGLAVWTVPQEVAVKEGTADANVKVRLQRIGGYDGDVTLDHGSLPDGVAGVSFSNGGTIDGEDLGAQAQVSFASDPADGHRHVQVTADGESGGPGDGVQLRLRFDTTPPVVGAPWPHIVFRTGSYGSTAPVRLAWSSTDAQGPVTEQTVRRSLDGGSFGVYGRPGATATRADATMARGVPTAWRIEARDLVKNVALSDPLETRLAVTQAGVMTLSPGWTPVIRDTAANHDLIRTSQVGETATLTFTGRAVAIVAPTGPGGGRFKVRLDGEVVATVKQATSTTTVRRLLWVSGALEPGEHTIRVTSRAGVVKLDAFLLLR